MNLNQLKIGLVIVGEDNYINQDYVITLIKSFLYHNKWFDGDIIFFEDDYYNKISESNKERLKLYYDKIIYKKVDAYGIYHKFLDDYSDRIFEKKYIHAYPKMEVFNLEEYDKILCIDGDIIVNDNLYDLFIQNIDFGATSSLRYFYEDIPLSYENESFRLSGEYMADSNGFNSGVMYFGTKKFLSKSIYKEFILYLNNNIQYFEDVGLFDQDFLNYFFRNKYEEYITWLPPFYNVGIYKLQFDYYVNDRNIKDELDFIKEDLCDKGNELLDNAKIVHYLYKYNDIPHNNKASKIYEKYSKLTNDNFKLNRLYNINLSNFKIGLVIIANDGYINNQYAITCIKSFLYHNTWFDGDIIFFEDINNHYNISEENKQILYQLYDQIKFIQFDYESYLYIMNEKFAEGEKLYNACPKFELFKLSEYDKLLCVDGDIVFVGNIKELFIKDIPFGATSSLMYNLNDIEFYQLSDNDNFIKYTDYHDHDSGGFNSGVLYFGNKSLLNEKTCYDFRDFINHELNTNKFYQFFDQCFLNYFFNDTEYHKYITIINPIYNCHVAWYEIYNKNKYCIYKLHNLVKNAKILHYTWKPERMEEWDLFLKLFNINKNLPTDYIQNYKNLGKWYVKDVKVSLCVACKNENNYIREFIWHYKQLGFDHIFIIDNNDNEYLEDVINDYIELNYVTIIDWRGRTSPQYDGYTYVYKKFGDDYDWMAFFDCDELLQLNDGSKNIQEFLLQYKFEKYNLINVFWQTYGDEGLITVENNDYSMKDRFKTPIFTHTIEDYQPKSIIKTKLPIEYIGDAHVGNQEDFIKRCNSDGDEIVICKSGGSRCLPISLQSAQLNHYRTKTLEEYVTCRYQRSNYPWNCNEKLKNINFFFLFNERTKEKEEWLMNNYPEIYQQLFEHWDLEDFYKEIFTHEEIYADYSQK